MKKTVLITGASVGIGKATARYFQEKGWQVAATMRSPEKEEELHQLENVKVFRLDVSDKESIQKAIEDTQAAFGSIDAIVNNAGYGVFGPFEMASEEQIKKQYDTNVFGLMNVCRAILPYFREQKGGVIVNVSSCVGRFAVPLQSLYNSTKFAIEGFTESLQYELEPFGIRVKLVEPGAIKTNFFNAVDTTHTKNSPYDRYSDTVMKKLMEAETKGSEPELVAKEIYKAASITGNKLRFPVGADAKIFLKLKRLLSDKTLFNLIKSQVKK